MAYSLNDFIADCRSALQDDPGPGGREKVRDCVARACLDEEFVSRHFGPDNTEPRKVLYEDPDLGFCILAHVHTGPKTSPPHDHGPSWAICGQVKGSTEMTEWRKLEAPKGGEPGKVEAVKTYTMEPGDAQVYQEGELHSPAREDETRLLRIEGVNMDGVKRDAYVAVA